jgi:hypothetical protein
MSIDSMNCGSSRRQFISRSAQGVAAMGLAAAVNTTVDATEKESTHTGSKFNSVARVMTKTKAVRDLAIGKNDEIFIAADKAVLVFDAKGKALRTIELAGVPRAVAVRPDGNLLVGMKDYVKVLSPQGKQLEDWDKIGRDTVITELVQIGDQIYVADSVHKLVWRYSTKGKLLGQIEGHKGEFKVPHSFFALSAGKNGHVHVANPGRHRIETYTADGKFVSSWGSRSRQAEGFGGCCNPVSLATLSDGRFITAERGQARVKLFDSEGKFVSQLIGPGQLFEGPRPSQAGDDGCKTGGLHVATDSRNRVVVLDRVTRQMVILAPQA